MGVRARARIAAAAAFVAVPALVLASPAQGAAYRYWTYWSVADGSWSFATMGPAQSVPADGSVEGWRLSVTTESGSAQDAPRALPSFADICAATPATDGRKRVALVVDPGEPQDAPASEAPASLIATCVTVEPDATGYEVLRTAHRVRIGDSGLVCGIDGYPARECAALVDEQAAATQSAEPVLDAGADPSAASVQDGAGSALPLVAGLVVIAMLGAGAFALRRRRS